MYGHVYGHVYAFVYGHVYEYVYAYVYAHVYAHCYEQVHERMCRHCRKSTRVDIQPAPPKRCICVTWMEHRCPWHPAQCEIDAMSNALPVAPHIYNSKCRSEKRKVFFSWSRWCRDLWAMTYGPVPVGYDVWAGTCGL